MAEIERNFIHDIIDEDLREDPNLKIHTRFPPEPNGYLHIGSVKAIAREIGYADDMKAYKADPTAFPGNVADVSMFLRVAVTGKLNAPDLYTVMQILGEDETRARIANMIEKI